MYVGTKLTTHEINFKQILNYSYTFSFTHTSEACDENNTKNGKSFHNHVAFVIY